MDPQYITLQYNISKEEWEVIKNFGYIIKKHRRIDQVIIDKNLNSVKYKLVNNNIDQKALILKCTKRFKKP